MNVIKHTLIAASVLVALAGCSSKPQYGDKKEDWAKTAPPKGWIGPGQPGGPPSGPMSPVPGVGQTAASAPSAPQQGR